MKYKNWSYFFLMLCLFVVFPSKAQNITPVKQPNIVLFFVDDLGWSHLGYRKKMFETPHIDLLAKAAFDFQNASIATPTCSPSRATLVTGKHPARLKMVRHIPHQKSYGFDVKGRTTQKTHLWKKDPAQFPSVNWLDLEHITYAEVLKELGYYNLFVGKWHLGHEPYHPIKQGFDQQIGTTNWGHPKGYNAPFFKHSDVYKDIKEGHLTKQLTDDTVNFIKNYQQDKPFMISMWYYSVHSPFDGREDLVKHFKEKGLTGRMAHYAAMVTAMDESVGRVRGALKNKGIDKNTVIIFLSDQGGMYENLPHHGGKMSDTLYEGGARVPFMVYWPGVSQNAVSNEVVQSTDLFPTLIDIAGGNSKEYDFLDGVSLLPTIADQKNVNRGTPVFGYRAYEDLYASVHEKQWKLVAYRSGIVKLYNLDKDIGEQNDVASQNPSIVKSLSDKLVAWEKEMQVEQYSGLKK